MVYKSDTATCEAALARRIWQYQLARKDGHTTSIPSERHLAEMFDVTRHAVRKSIQILEDEGKLMRLSRRAIVPAIAQAQEDDLAVRCINFIRSPAYSEPAISWLIEDYLTGYTTALEEHHVKTRHVICADDERDYESLLWQHVPFHQQGCVLVARKLPGLLGWLAERDIPHVVQYAYAYDLGDLPPHHRVFINKVGGGFAAVQHLAELGHRRIGFAGNAPPRVWAKAVYEGYEAALKTLALEMRPQHVWAFNTNRLEVALDEVRHRFDPNDLPTAFLTGNDITAVALLHVAAEHGVKVPEQLSVHGFNDQFEAAQTDPPLTTMRVPRRRLGSESVKLLLEAIENPQLEPQTRVLSCELVERGTVAPPPA